MKSAILIAFLIISSVINSYAQLNIKGGMNLANQITEVGNQSFIKENKIGLLFGINHKFSISESMSFRPGLQYSPKGHRQEARGMNFYSSSKYLEAPLDLVYTTQILSFHSGFYLAYLIASEANGFSNKKNMSAFDLGINLGFAFEFDGFALGVNYSRGLSNAGKSIFEDAFLRNRVISLFLVYEQ